MENQDAQNLARRWITDSELNLGGRAYEDALWTAVNAIEDLVPELDYSAMIPVEDAELPPHLSPETRALQELLVICDGYLFRITGWVDSDSAIEVAIKRVRVSDFNEPTITENRIDVNRADVRRRGWEFLHRDGSRLLLKTDRIVNANYEREDPEEFAQELSRLAGWDVSTDSSRAPITII
ncbi:MAG: hypothetical protein WAP35_05145 [Solirubrobacterales bacterium]